MYAELEQAICSGPRRGKEFTYALLDERVPPAPALSRAEALAELTRRYFTGHGPATLKDFTWWSGLTVADAKAGLAAAGLESQPAGEQVYDLASSAPGDDQQAPGAQTHSHRVHGDSRPVEPGAQAFLLATFDEFLVGYAGFDKARGPAHPFNPRILYDGQVIGAWQRTFKKATVLVDVVPFSPLSPEQQQAITAAAHHYAAYLGRPVELVQG
jgi:hypothetical protein